ncbi:MAG: tRNA uracil 4-sulfurtransferase ThiI, partial [Pseudomonadales bacterium]|nr:tRNA uracil 4-sulfurtransferase ThiI [Pseudomonadales bacterium]
MEYIVRFFPEITIKTRPVRRRLIRILRRNLSLLLQRIDASVQIKGEWDKFEISTASDDAELLQKLEDILISTPGVGTVARVRKTPLPDFAGILAHTLAYYGDQLPGRTFAVRCRRNGQHGFTSTDVERYVGAGILAKVNTAGVDLQNPDVVVRITILRDQLLVVEKLSKGLGGYPLGSQDGVLSLISGGFDSAVASFQCIKRGLLTHYCFFNLGGREHELAVKELAVYLWMKYGSSHRVKFVTVPFAEVVEQILTRVDNAQMGVVLKRMMLRAAAQVAAELKLQALVTGEAVAQVSSQTLANLAVIDSVTQMLVLRPLVLMDKQDIIDQARQIGTEAFSSHIPEYCGVISVKPTTRARAERIQKEEENFDFSVLEQAVENRAIQMIDKVVEGLGYRAVHAQETA